MIYAHFFVQIQLTHTFLLQKEFEHTFLLQKQFTHTFVSRKRFTRFFCCENNLRTSSGKFLRIESCHPESLDFLGLCCIYTNCSDGNLMPAVMRCTWRPEVARNFLGRRVSLDSWREGRSLISSLLTCKVGVCTVSDWQDGLPQVTRTRGCLDTSRPRTWCTSLCSSQTTGTLRAFGWTVGKSRIQWKQSSHSDRNLKMIHFLWTKTTTGHFSWTIKIPIFSFIGT